MKLPHIHWHRLKGGQGLFLNPVYVCRCGSVKVGYWA